MDAPLYPPSTQFVAPDVVPSPMTTRDSSLADFIANPQALAIISKEAPGFVFTTRTPMLKPHLGNMSPRTMVQFGALKAADLDRVDAQLKAANIMSGTGK